jgi:hypothetical protein
VSMRRRLKADVDVRTGSDKGHDMCKTNKMTASRHSTVELTSTLNTRDNSVQEHYIAGMSNLRPAGRLRPFASTPAARTKDTVIWSFNGQNCSFYILNWINVRRSQKNGMLFFIQNVFFTLGNMIDYFQV